MEESLIDSLNFVCPCSVGCVDGWSKIGSVGIIRGGLRLSADNGDDDSAGELGVDVERQACNLESLFDDDVRWSELVEPITIELLLNLSIEDEFGDGHCVIPVVQIAGELYPDCGGNIEPERLLLLLPVDIDCIKDGFGDVEVIDTDDDDDDE